MTNRKKVLLTVGAALVTVASAAIVADAVVSGPSCGSSPAATIAALRPGAVWNGQGQCYDTPTGVVVPSGVTVTNATFDEDTSTNVHPIVLVTNASNVVLSDLTLNGGDTNPGHLYSKLVGQEGVDLRSSSYVTISNVDTNDTYGDGLTLFFSDQKRTPDTQVAVDGMTITNAGRDGISPANVTDSTFANLSVHGVADTGADFESDLKGVGSGSLVFTDVDFGGPLNVIEPLSGNGVELNDCTGTGAIVDNSPGATVTIANSTWSLRYSADDGKAPQIVVNGGNLVIARSTLTRTPATHAPESSGWSVTDHGALSFLSTAPPPGPIGTADATSSVLMEKLP